MDSKGGLAAAVDRERTFQFDESLPPLPVPDLQETLQKYLDSVRPLTTDEEYRETERIVREFGSGLGRELHVKLLERSQTRKNWLEEWWSERVYLTSRTPLGVCSMYGANRTIEGFWPPCPGTAVERAAISTWHLLTFYEALRKETIPVQKSKTGNVIFSMDQLRLLFNGSREPGTDSDKIINFFKTEREGPCPTHMVVSCNGHLFRVDSFNNRGKLLHAKELARQLQSIKDRSKQRGQCVATLTADERSSYAENRWHLLSLDPVNAEHIRTIDSSLAMLALDDDNPQTVNELLQNTMSGGSLHNHWLDKSYLMIFNANGTLSCICDHAPFDAMVGVDMTHWCYQRMEKNGGTWPEPDTEDGEDWSQPEELVFVIDSVIEMAIPKARAAHYKLVDNVEILCSYFRNFGKDWCKQYRLHPDIVCQLSLQLAYYKMYERPTATYETATTRQFYHGRTETCRSCTQEALDWCRAMVDPSASKAQRAELLKAAYTKHAYLMGDCLQNKGCDRHLLGLYFISDEMGLPIPEIFTDAGFVKSGGGGNFTLSTSLSGYTPFLGLVTPMCQDGYFLTYRVVSDKIEFCTVTYRNSSETDNHTMMHHIVQSMIEIQDLAMHAAAKL